MTSTDVVRHVRRALGTRRVGHAGTLDPDATGVLLVCVGDATRCVPYLQDTTKAYRTVGRLGTETRSDDAASDVIRTEAFDHVDRAMLDHALLGFRGEIQQTPPRVSALRLDGKRLHERVRQGEDVDARLKPRPVVAHEISLASWEPPDFELELTVGKGFYVRSLVRDVGRALESAAHVLTLRRTRVGRFDEAAALPLESVGPLAMLPVAEALGHLPRATATAEGERRLRCGQHVEPGDDLSLPEVEESATVCAYGPSGIIAICELRPDGRLRVRRGFPAGA